MELTISGASPGKEDLLLKGKLLWQLLNKNKETNLRLFGVWFGLLVSFLLYVYSIREIVEKTESVILIFVTGLIYFYSLSNHYINRRKYFNNIQEVAQQVSDFGPFEISIDAEKIVYKNNLQQLSCTLNRVTSCTLYQNHIFILFNEEGLQKSIIIDKEDISEQVFEEILDFVAKR